MPSNFYKSNYGSFEKLNKLNYLSWKEDVLSVLDSLKASKIVTGEEQEPPIGNTAAMRAATADYEARSAQARTTIRFSIHEEIRERLSGLSDPAEMWEILKEFDSSATETRRTKLAIEFHGLKPENDEKISAYCARLIRYRKPLQGTDEEITDRALLNHIFTTVPASYRTIVHSLKRLPREEATVERVVEELTDYEQLVSPNDTVGDSNTASTSGTALYAQGGKGGKGGKSRKGRKVEKGGKGDGNGQVNQHGRRIYSCTNCQMNNHTTENCRRNGNLSFQKGRKHARSDSIVCYYCLGTGHTKYECDLRKRAGEFQKRRENGRALLANQEQALMPVNRRILDNPENQQ